MLHATFCTLLISLVWSESWSWSTREHSSECSFTNYRVAQGKGEGLVYQDVPPWITATEWEMTADRGSSSSLSPRSVNDEMIATPAGPAPNTTTFPTLHSFHTYLHCLLSTLGFSWACKIYYQRRPFCITDVVCTTS